MTTQILLALIGFLATAVSGLAVYNFQQLRKEVQNNRMVQFQQNQIMFELIAKLHPAEAFVIAEAMNEAAEVQLGQGRQVNGRG